MKAETCPIYSKKIIPRAKCTRRTTLCDYAHDWDDWDNCVIYKTITEQQNKEKEESK